jgi:hypothetical protein
MLPIDRQSLCETKFHLLHGAVLLEKLTGLQLVKKFPASYGTRTFITAFTSGSHLSLSWANPIQFISSQPITWRSILILSSHVRLGLPSGLFPSGCPTKPWIGLSYPHPRYMPRQSHSSRHCCGATQHFVLLASETYLALRVKWPMFCPIFKKLGFFYAEFIKYPIPNLTKIRLVQRFSNCGPRNTGGHRVLPLWSS